MLKIKSTIKGRESLKYSMFQQMTYHQQCALVLKYRSSVDCGSMPCLVQLDRHSSLDRSMVLDRKLGWKLIHVADPT